MRLSEFLHAYSNCVSVSLQLCHAKNCDTMRHQFFPPPQIFGFKMIAQRTEDLINVCGIPTRSHSQRVTFYAR